MLPSHFGEVPSVGMVLRQHILDLDGITQERLAVALGVSRHSINELVNDRRAVTASMALRLARVLGTTPRFWLNLQNEVDLQAAERQLKTELSTMPVLRHGLEVEDVIESFDSIFQSDSEDRDTEAADAR